MAMMIPMLPDIAALRVSSVICSVTNECERLVNFVNNRGTNMGTGIEALSVRRIRKRMKLTKGEFLESYLSTCTIIEGFH